MRRTGQLTTTALATVVLLLVVPGIALAHASFDVQQLPAGSTQDLVLRVPLERDAVNDLVEVLVPGAFTIEDCAGAEGWSCSQAATSDGDTVVSLERSPDGPGNTERFALTVTAPAEEGVYAFPTIQTYDDGEEAAWIGEAGSDRPAPRLQVGDETAPVEFSGDATPHTGLAEATPSPARATTAEDPATEDPSPEPNDAPTVQPTTAPAGEDSGGGSSEAAVGGAALATVAVVVVAIVAAAVAAAVVLRRRRG